MIRTKRKKGFFVGFDFSTDAMTEIGRFFRTEHISIVALTVKDILDETIAQKLAWKTSDQSSGAAFPEEQGGGWMASRCKDF